MIHHDLCEGLGMRTCDSCARSVQRYSETVRKAQTVRIKPIANPPHCADWLAMPSRALDSSHSTL